MTFPLSNRRDLLSKELLTVSQAAKLCRVHPRKVTAWGRKGWLTNVYEGGQLKLITSEVAALQRQINMPVDELL